MVELKRLSAGNFFLRSKATEALHNQIHSLLRTWVVDIYSFMDMLLAGGSIISGSLALAMGFSKYKQHVKDMDIYASDNGWVLVQLLIDGEGMEAMWPITVALVLKEALGYEIHSGYRCIPEAVINPTRIHQYEKIPFIMELVTLKKGDKIIDIIFTHHDCPIISVLNFHSSIVMNIFTGASIVCIYPETTCQDISLKTKGFNTFTIDNSTRAEVAFEKYGCCGVTIVEANKCLDGSVCHHICERDPVCPHTI
jgi:hypothetical protein